MMGARDGVDDRRPGDASRPFARHLAEWEFGWGTSFLDADNDGDQDLFMVGSLTQFPFLIAGFGVGNPGRHFIKRVRPATP